MASKPVRPIVQGIILFTLLTVTVPWFAGKMNSEVMGLPAWVLYALILNVIFSTSVCFLYEKWWVDHSEEEEVSNGGDK